MTPPCVASSSSAALRAFAADTVPPIPLHTVQVSRVHRRIRTKPQTVFIINTTNYGLCVCGVRSIARGTSNPRKPFATPSASRALSRAAAGRAEVPLPRAASPRAARESA